MSHRKTLRGRELSYDLNNIYLNDRIVGGVEPKPFGNGKAIYVNSNVDGTDGTSWSTAVGTLDEAFALCTANSGDVIIVHPHHAETVTGAGGIAHDVAGVRVVGMRYGNARPSFLMDGGTTVTYLISAANAYVEGLEFKAGHADVVTCFNVTAANATIRDCVFKNNVVDENFVTEIKATSTTDNNADGLRVEDCFAFTVDAAGAEFIELNADIDRLHVAGNRVFKDAGTAAKLILQATGKDITNAYVGFNKTVSGATSGDQLIDNDTTANSGLVEWNFSGHHQADAVVNVDADGVRLFNNFSVGTDTQSGVLNPVADTLT